MKQTDAREGGRVLFPKYHQTRSVKQSESTGHSRQKRRLTAEVKRPRGEEHHARSRDVDDDERQVRFDNRVKTREVRRGKRQGKSAEQVRNRASEKRTGSPLRSSYGRTTAASSKMQESSGI